MDKYNLILLNGDQKCEGEITRKQGEQKSAIDFVLVNQAGYKYFRKMEIEENRLMCDLSDHCLVRVDLNLKSYHCDAEAGECVTEYYKTNCEKIKKGLSIEDGTGFDCSRNDKGYN